MLNDNYQPVSYTHLGWTWYTGTAGWYYYVGIQEILGLKKLGATLVFNPNIPIAWDSFKLDYTYMDTDVYKRQYQGFDKEKIVVFNDVSDAYPFIGELAKKNEVYALFENDLPDTYNE